MSALKFTYHIFKSNYIYALGSNSKLKKHHLPFLYFKLGMYKSSSNADLYNSNYHNLFSKVISLANVGDKTQSEHFLSIFEKKYPSHIDRLIPELATYSPELAFIYSEKYKLQESPYFYSLHAYNYGTKLTNQKYSKKIKNACNENIEMTLLESNISLFEKTDILKCFNNYLKHYGLKTISLKNMKLNFNVNNFYGIKTQQTLKSLPLVSILIPTFNVETRIRSCIESLINQDYPNIELIIIDDASTDNTPKIISNLANEYRNIKTIFLTKNVGPFIAKNYALTQSSGEFITTQDADDWAHPERISRQIKPLLKNTTIMATMCNHIRISDNGKFYAKQHFPFNRLNPSSPMFRKNKVLKYAGLWDCVKIAADTEFIERLKIVFGHKSIVSTKLPLVFAAHRVDSLMTSESTGNLKNKMSPIRLDYWEAWRQWHIKEIAIGRTPYMPTLSDYQPQFIYPDEISNIDILKVISKI